MKNFKKVIPVLCFALALTLAIPVVMPLLTVKASVTSEGKSSGEIVNNETLEAPYISSEALSLYAGQSSDLYMNELPADVDLFSSLWQSSNTSVATVDKNGRVTGVGEGKANVTFTSKKYGMDPGKTYFCQVTVTYGPVTSVTVPDSDGNENTDSKIHTIFILNHNLVNAKVPEFYKYLGDPVVSQSTVDYIFSYSVASVLADAAVKSGIADADEVIMVGLQPTDDNLDALKSLGKAGTKFYFVPCQTFYNRFLDSPNLNILSAQQVWIDMYYANIADAKQLNFTDSDSKPTLTAGFGLAVYLQYRINNNSSTDITYSYLASIMSPEVLHEIDEKQFNKTKKLLTEEPAFAINESDSILHLSEVNRPDLINQYTQKSYDIFNDFYRSSSSGIFSMEQTASKTPVCYDTVKLDTSKSNSDKVYTWTGGKWELQKTYTLDEYALRVLTWSDGKWNTKVYRYTDTAQTTNPLKTNRAVNVQRDSAGDWYMAIEYNDEYYIYQLDNYLKVKYKVKVSGLTNSRYANFYPVTNGNVLLETYYSADTSSDEANWNEKLRLYNSLQLINLESGKIIKEYDTGHYPYGYVKVDGKFIYMRDKSKENIVVIDFSTGEVVNIIRLADYDYLIKPHDYSEELGFQYDYDFDISGKYIYLLKKNGVYRIDMGNGKFRKIMDNSYEPFDIQDMRFLDFSVKNSNAIYVLAVNFDEKCATNFYSYTK